VLLFTPKSTPVQTANGLAKNKKEAHNLRRALKSWDKKEDSYQKTILNKLSLYQDMEIEAKEQVGKIFSQRDLAVMSASIKSTIITNEWLQNRFDGEDIILSHQLKEYFFHEATEASQFLCEEYQTLKELWENLNDKLMLLCQFQRYVLFIILEEQKEEKMLNSEDCQDCGKPLDENHQTRTMLCEVCDIDLDVEVCAEDHSVMYCEDCHLKGC
jgi:hypothetical protein